MWIILLWRGDYYKIIREPGILGRYYSQPDWKKKESIALFGEPRLAFLVSAGNMDSMVNHYTVSRKHRKTDAYSPGGEMGLRPDRAVTVYSNLIRQTYKNTPIILGGIGSLSQKNGPLRLLGRCYETFGPAGFRSRYDLLWNGREEYPEDCRSSGYGEFP